MIFSICLCLHSYILEIFCGLPHTLYTFCEIHSYIFYFILLKSKLRHNKSLKRLSEAGANLSAVRAAAAYTCSQGPGGPAGAAPAPPRSLGRQVAGCARLRTPRAVWWRRGRASHDRNGGGGPQSGSGGSAPPLLRLRAAAGTRGAGTGPSARPRLPPR